MANLAVRPHVVEFFDLARAGQPTCGWRSWRSPKGPRWQGRSLQELSGPAVPLLVRHPDGQLIANPARKLQLQPGDVLVIFGEVSDLNPPDRD